MGPAAPEVKRLKILRFKDQPQIIGTKCFDDKRPSTTTSQIYQLLLLSQIFKCPPFSVKSYFRQTFLMSNTFFLRSKMSQRK